MTLCCRKNISDDATLIRLHRELKEKCVLLESLETKFLTAEQVRVFGTPGNIDMPRYCTEKTYAVLIHVV